MDDAPQLGPAETAARLPFAPLVAALREAVLALARGEIDCPPRQVVPLAGGGQLLSMVCTAPDLALHKLVSVVPANRMRGLPTIQGRVQVLDAASGSLLLGMDGATVTGRRTAALSMLGIEVLAAAPPRAVLLIGTGNQARQHALALSALYPAARLQVLGRGHGSAERFCQALAGDGVAVDTAGRLADAQADVVICCTTSRTPVYTVPGDPSRLVVAVGSFSPQAAEVSADTVRASRCFVDDPIGAAHEAGDLLQAGLGPAEMRTLAEALCGERPSGPVLFKTVGCAAWDLAAARVALRWPGLAES
jgi:1-piperideine-2-carboxylate/1-pyrroline-2-carboxylate reductase [NAD(P)H]